MSSREVNFVLGPTRSGKTTFCHFLTGTVLLAKKAGFGVRIETVLTPPEGKEIGQTNEAQTSEVQDFGNFLDFPGFEDTRGIDFDLRTLIQLKNKFEEFKHIRLILIIEECKIKSANGADLTKITNDFINLLGLTEKEVPAIKLVVTKTSNKFCKLIPNGLKGLCANSKNFIIDAIINQDIQILAFEEPSETFDITNLKTRFSFMKQLESTKYLCGKEFVKNIDKAIENKVKFIKLGDKRFPDIVFASETKFKNELKSDFLLCIDCNKDIYQEDLEINAPYIVVLTQRNEKIFWEIEGFMPCVIFSKSIKEIINGKKLVVSFKNNSNIKFPNPTSKDFSSNQYFFRLESLCINGSFWNLISWNNKFLDLIMYINPSFGKIKFNKNF